jgi:uncharacterized protein YndB with AHSA1/START domain
MEIRSTSVKRDIWIQTTLEKAWSALTVPEESNRWQTRSCSIDLRVGGRAEFDYGWGVRYGGTFVDIIELEKFTLKDDEDGSLSITSLVPENGGVRVVMEYRGLWEGDQGHSIRDNMGFGTYQFMRNMKSVLEDSEDMRPDLWQGWLGISHTSVRSDHAGQFPLDEGTVILGVKKDSPAGLAGLLPGDVVVKANQLTIRSFDDLESLVGSMHPDAPLTLTLWRDSQTWEVNVQVAAYPVSYTA